MCVEDAASGTQTVTVVICAYASGRWDSLVEAVASVEQQTQRPEETIVVIDYNPALFERAREQFADVLVVENPVTRGLSGARNAGVRLASGDVVAFLDDDAWAHPTWLRELVGAYRDPDVVGTGGAVEPRWQTGPVGWLPDEFYWTIGCSYRGLPDQLAAIRNPIGANMSFRREAILRAGGFRDGIGRVAAVPMGCEETELAVRVASETPGAKIMHVPAARVDHLVEPQRTSWRYFVSRCWAEGLSKAIVVARVGRGSGLATERTYVLRTLPSGLFGGLRRALHGDLAGLGRAVAIVVGLSVTTAGYVCGRVTRAGAGSPGGST